MKKILFGTTALLFLLSVSACCDDDDKTNDEPAQPETVQLISPDVRARIADPLNQTPFTGILEVYPCSPESSIYYGNYVNGKKTVFNGYYTILDGHIYGEYNRPLKLPIGTYNMVYWGTPKYDEPIYNTPAINEPGLTQDADLSTLYFRLRANTDGTYMPVYDLVHAVKPANIGTEDLQAALTRVTAGIRIIAKMQDNAEFNSAITGIQARIGGIAEKMNLYTAEVENTTKIVKFDLERSSDNTIMSNATVMLFPSAENPLLELIITLADGTQHTLSKNLGSTLSPNTKLTLNIILGEIISGGNPGDFSIEDWNEVSETIEFPIIN